jgi:serine/threonine protein kinase
MGAVYLAHDPRLDRLVALKIPNLRGEPEQEERFYREARAAAALHHPNLCPVHDVGQVEGVPYLTMAYIDGMPLSSLIRPGGPIPVGQAVLIVRRIALALQEAHDYGVVHRDLKPANVILDRRGEPVVMDFGLARRTAGEEVRLTRSGELLGTPAYMSPEQVNSDLEAIGPCSDVYALGVILYELLTGRLPFQGPFGTLMASILHDEPAPPSRHRPGISPRVEAACLKALRKAPGDRFPSMSAFAAALQACSDEGEAPLPAPLLEALPADPAPATASVRISPRREEAEAREARWLIAGGVLLLLLYVLLLALMRG